MKKLIYIISGVVLFSLLSYAQSITVKNPGNGVLWLKNTAHTIEWRKSGDIQARVKIRLFNHNGTVRIKGITDDTPNNGSFRCPPNIFNDVPDGNYRIRVRTRNNNVTGNSAVFRIGPPPDNGNSGNNGHNFDSSRFSISRVQGTKANRVNVSPANIEITHPRRGQLFNLSSVDTVLFPIRISWRKTGTQHKFVRISLKRLVKGQLFEIVPLTLGTTNNENFLGVISRDLKTSIFMTNTIIIKTLDGKIHAESEPFRIEHDYN